MTDRKPGAAPWEHCGKWGAFVSTPQPGMHAKPYRNPETGHCVAVSHDNYVIGAHRLNGDLCWCAPSYLEPAEGRQRPILSHRSLYSHELH